MSGGGLLYVSKSHFDSFDRPVLTSWSRSFLRSPSILMRYVLDACHVSRSLLGRSLICE